MNRLLCAGFRRYIHSAIFWIATAGTVIVSLWGAISYRDNGVIHDIVSMGVWFAFAALISLVIGMQFSYGIFRNQVIAGHEKAKIYFVELILGMCASLFFMLISCLVYLLIVPSIITVFPDGVLLKVLFGMLLFYMAGASLCVVVSMLITQAVIPPILNILLMLALFQAAIVIEKRLDEPKEFVQYIHGENDELIETGVTKSNPDYIEEPWKRTLYQTVLYAMPHWQMQQMSEIIYHYTYSGFHEFDGGDLEAEEIEFLEVGPWYSVGFLMVIGTAGYLGFRKKDLR